MSFSVIFLHYSNLLLIIFIYFDPVQIMLFYDLLIKAASSIAEHSKKSKIYIRLGNDKGKETIGIAYVCAYI